MSALRNDEQIQLNKLHILLLKSSDSYAYAADLLNEAFINDLFKKLAKERSLLAQEVEGAIRESDDLPSEPNATREVYEQFLQRLEVFFSSDETSNILSQSLESEIELEKELKSTAMIMLDENYSSLRLACVKSIQDAIDKLKSASS